MIDPLKGLGVVRCNCEVNGHCWFCQSILLGHARLYIFRFAQSQNYVLSGTAKGLLVEPSWSCVAYLQEIVPHGTAHNVA